MTNPAERSQTASDKTESAFSRLSDGRLIRELAYIDGEWRMAEDQSTVTVTNPADGAVLGTVPSMGPNEAEAAVEAADAAFAGWRALLPQERGAILRRWYEEMIAAKDDLAVIMTLEQGKPLKESLGEIDYAASFIAWYAEEAKRPNIEGVTSHLPDAEMRVQREPLGVAALITPWNFPSAMITRKAAAALAAGCTAVVHPSRETPFSGLALAALAERAGLPAGVFNVVTGPATRIGEVFCTHEKVRAVSFTGSTEIGRLIYRQGAETIKRQIMELGGHAPLIAFADCDFEKAVEEAIKAKFATSGQDCLAANRIYVERAIYEDFVQAFAEKTRAMTVGPGLEPDVEIGPLMNARAVEKAERHVADAVEKGARLMCGGERHEAGDLFYKPTVLADVPDEALIFSEETFGPVAAIAPFDSEDEVIKRANSTEYGLVAYLHSGDPTRISRVANALEFGMVAVNRTKITGAPIPFGGVKQSGLGREGSRLGMEAFTEVKFICTDTRA